MYLLKVELNDRECKLAPTPPPPPLPIRTRVTFREFEELSFPNWSTSKVKKKMKTERSYFSHGDQFEIFGQL